MTHELSTKQIGTKRSWPLYTLGGIGVIAILFVACYYDTLTWMYSRYISSDSYYSHGFLVPLISGFFIWQKRNELIGKKAEHSWLGLILMLLAVLIHIAGTVSYIFSLSGFSIFLFVFGATLFLYGKSIFKIIIFPLIFLIFMVPLPMALINMLSFPLKMLVAESGVQIVSIFGIPVYREGFHISIPAGNLLVGNPCSGLRSLISFLALGAVFAYLSNMQMSKKWVLFLFAAPVALVSNIIRVPILILISHFWGLSAAEPDTFCHTASGILVFICGLFMLLYFSKFLGLKT